MAAKHRDPLRPPYPHDTLKTLTEKYQNTIGSSAPGCRTRSYRLRCRGGPRGARPGRWLDIRRRRRGKRNEYGGRLLQRGCLCLLGEIALNSWVNGLPKLSARLGGLAKGWAVL